MSISSHHLSLLSKRSSGYLQSEIVTQNPKPAVTLGIRSYFFLVCHIFSGPPSPFPLRPNMSLLERFNNWNMRFIIAFLKLVIGV